MVGVDRAAAGALVGGAASSAPGFAPGLAATKADAGAARATPFSGLVHSIMDQTQTLSQQASEAVSGLLSGQGVEIHDVMIAQQKASVAFELALQVRNKAVAAYQQLMGMQF
jgi:flagellar hook-basal body complex protein FliE